MPYDGDGRPDPIGDGTGVLWRESGHPHGTGAGSVFQRSRNWTEAEANPDGLNLPEPGTLVGRVQEINRHKGPDGSQGAREDSSAGGSGDRSGPVSYGIDPRSGIDG